MMPRSVPRRPFAWAGRLRLAIVGIIVAVLAVAGAAQGGPGQATSDAWQAQDREIAARFAPVFHQGLVGTGRFDYITSFDFDGDWTGDNNWDHAADEQYPLRAVVYYAVSETSTHYFVHYAAFHPRDYKGGELTGSLLSQAVRRGAEASQRVRRTSIADEIVLAHENDLEGCLVIIRKLGPRIEDARVVAVETLAHNRYLKYVLEPTLGGDVGVVQVDDGHPHIYIEPKGHGMEAYVEQPVPAPAAFGSAERANTDQPSEPGAGNGLAQRIAGVVEGIDAARRQLNNEGAERIRLYRFAGRADDPETSDGDIGYDLVATYDTFWTRAHGGESPTYADVQDYGTRTISVARADGSPEVRRVPLGPLGSAFRGREGAENMARPPWAWFDATERDRPLGEWFLDPAGSVRDHFDTIDDVSDMYVHQPFMGVFRPSASQ